MYIYKTKPFKHQEEIIDDSWKRPYYALFMEMGLGKSKVIIDTIGKLKLEGEIDSALIIAPKGVYDNWVKQEIIKNLTAVYGADSVAAYYGATKQEDRQDIVKRFEDPDSPLRFFVGHPKTGGYGITLNEASTVIYYSNSYDLESRLQSEDRAHRIGQKKSVTYVDLIAPDTIDEKIVEALRNKINLADQVLNEETKNWLR